MILIAEDNPDTRERLAALLEEHRFQVVRATDGREALKYLQAAMDHVHPLPALVITDLNMPNMDGRQLIAEMARTEALAALPVIEVSGTSPESLHMWLTAALRPRRLDAQINTRPAAGVVGSFIKPIRGEKEKELLALVAQHDTETAE